MGWSVPIITATVHHHTGLGACHSLVAVVGEGVDTGLDTVVVDATGEATVVGEGESTGLDTVIGDATGEGLSVGLPT